MAIEKAKISSGELFALLVSAPVGGTIFTIAGLADRARADAWLAAFAALILAYAVSAVFLAVRPRRPDQSMPDWIVEIGGPYLGAVLNVVYMLFFIIMTALLLRQVVEIVSLAVLPRTPRAVITALLAICSALAARLGIEVTARAAQIYTLFGSVGIAIVLVSIAPYADLRNMQPVLASGLRPVLAGSLPTLACLALSVASVWLAPYVRSKKDLVTSVMWSTAVSGLVIFLLVVTSQGIFGYRGIQRMLVPALTMARAVRIGRVFERIDVIIVGMWLLIAFVSIALYTYLASTQVAWLGGSRHYRPVVLPLTGLICVLSLVLARSDAALSDFITVGAFAPYVLLHTLVIPLLLWVLLKVRRPAGPHEQEPENGTGDAP